MKSLTTLFILFALIKMPALSAGLLENLQILNKHNDGEVVASEEIGVNYIGGTGMTRTDVVDINPVHVALPTFKAGCGGIDYTMGSIHIASGKEMKKALKAIISDSVGYAFQLGLETMSPSVAETVTKIQGFANQLNSININSCEMAQSLVNSAWPSQRNANQFICQQASNNQFNDLVETRHKCHSDEKHASKVMRKASQKTDLLTGEYNIAKKVFEKLNLSPEEKNFFLNLTGTVVAINGKVTTYPPKEIKTLDLLLHGGILRDAYHFEGEYAISQKPLTISKGNSWKEKKSRAMRSLLKKISHPTQGDGVLSPEEETLMNGSKLPIGTLLVLKTRGGSASNLISLDDYAEIEAFASLKDAIFDVLYEVRSLAVILLDAQVSDEKLKEYIAGIDQVKGTLNFENNKILKKIAQVQELEKWLREVERNQRVMASEEKKS